MNAESSRVIYRSRSAIALVLLAAGCITVNVYFPESEVKALSERIEDAVRERAGVASADEEGAGEEGAVASRAALPRPLVVWGAGVGLVATALAVGVAMQQGGPPSPGVTNPAIRRIIESRAGRFAKLRQLKSKGVFGENRNGILEIRSLDGLPLSQRAQAQKLLAEENEDRRLMYNAIVDARGIDPSQLPLVRSTYAETLRQYAREGEWIQQPNGEWIKKPRASGP